MKRNESLRRSFHRGELVVKVRPSGHATARKQGRLVYSGQLRKFNRIVTRGEKGNG